MTHIHQRFIENDRKVVVLVSDTFLLDDLFEEIVSITKHNHADECRITINGCELAFEPTASVDTLRTLYTSELTRRKAVRHANISFLSYQQAEYDVEPFDFSHWSTAQRLDTLYMQLDMALLTGDIHWAKEVHGEVKTLEQVKKKRTV